MAEHPRYGLWILALAIALGVVGDYLFRPAGWGLNVLLWLMLGAGGALALVRGLRLAVPRDRLTLAAPALLFAGLMVWREAPELRALDALALAVALSLPVWRPAAGVWRASVREAAAGLTAFAHEATHGAARVLRLDVPWQLLRGAGFAGPVQAVVRGLAVAAAPFTVFCALFMMADAGFEQSITGLLAFDLDRILDHGLLALFCAWLAAGLLRGVLHDRTSVPALGAEGPPARWTLGGIEVAVALGAVDLLFAAFVLHQLPWLFGGQALVNETAGLTLADYARSGFLEIGLVSGLVLPMLLAIRWGMGPAVAPRHLAVFNAFSAGLLGLLLVIIASAAQRMAVYEASYGLTTLRVYVMAFECWMAALVVWFGATVLRRRPERFVAGAVAWGFAGIVGLHVPNVEAHVVAANLALAHPARALDVGYLTTLSADAVPALVAALPRLRGEDRELLEYRLHRAAVRDDDWRDWTWARHVARAAARPALAMAGHPPHVAALATLAAPVLGPVDAEPAAVARAAGPAAVQYSDDHDSRPDLRREHPRARRDADVRELRRRRAAG